MQLNQALDILKDEGYKYTEKREDILVFFNEQDGYRTASDLLNHLSQKYNGISYDTIYRNLHLFNELNILEQTELDGEKHFRLSCGHHEHHHHFICKSCGKTKAIEACPMNELNLNFNGYFIENHKFEIYGLCPSCH
ncbi:Fur family transcriptional regulator [Aquisalibacillus elongatus]|uniref:Fur family zinc uptake regulator n=1 Tax=Aquisalibacillus elongatus TaxID=485577 RepID=A0A3N5AYN4_9BACI|nr:Fur family transcriptional regulator [Aquisalibacillus elongatus]RPF50366.1 Fur family zinc uptake regulator [Aquisalibacillus elongatus]